ncbi:hypothetical protein LINPERHAP2_LOCUS37392 [Linum perenne]
MNGGGEHKMHGGEDRIPIAEPNSNGNQEQPPEEIVADENQQLPAEEEEAVTPPGQNPSVEKSILELEGCFTTLDIVPGSDDDPVDIEDQGGSQVPTRSTTATDYNLDDID